MRNPALDTALAVLGEVGIKPDVKRASKHYRLHWRHNGEPRSATVPCTPSDPNIRHIKREDIRKILRQDGLIGDGEPAERPKLPRLFLKDGAARACSIDIARHFDRRHKDVVASIERIAKELGSEFAGPSFRPSSYRDATGRKQKAYELNRDGFSIVVMGFTGNAALRWKARYIEAFNAMEGEIAGRDAALEARMGAIEANQDALLELIAERPKPKPRFTRPSLYRRQGKSPWRARP